MNTKFVQVGVIVIVFMVIGGLVLGSISMLFTGSTPTRAPASSTSTSR